MSKQRAVFKDPALEARFQELQAKTSDLRDQVQKSEEEGRKFIEEQFRTFLRGVKWQVVQWGSDYRLKPDDYEAERRMTELASIALNLGYHDSFSLFMDGATLDGRVDDGEFTISLRVYSRSADETEKTIKFLEIDADFSDILRDAIEQEIETSRREFSKYSNQLRVLRARLKALPPRKPDQRPETCWDCGHARSLHENDQSCSKCAECLQYVPEPKES